MSAQSWSGSAERLPRQPLPSLGAEEALYRLYWETLPNKDLARRDDGYVAWWAVRRDLSLAELRWLRHQVADLLRGDPRVPDGSGQ